MKKLLLIGLLFLLNGCALNRLFLFNEIDKVHTVKYTSHLKTYRAYFTRSDLKPMFRGQKYLFLYHPKKRGLYLLLRKPNRYLLYTMTKPNKAPRTLYAKSTSRVLRTLSKKGYRRTKNPTALGFKVKVGKRRYKKVKTLMVEVRDYRTLKALYQKAIKNYRYSLVSSVHEKLPRSMIERYFKRYERRAKTPAQKKALARIAKKLGIASRLTTQYHTTSATKPSSTKPQPQTTKETTESEEIEPLYPYYLRQASLKELETYLHSPKSKQELTYGEQQVLKHRLTQLKQEKMLQDAPLETLISEYKKNKDPRFKARILERIKALQHS